MPIRNPKTKRYGIFAHGVDNTTALDSPDIQSTLSVGLNCDIVDESLVKRRDGYTEVNAVAWSTRRIRGGFEYTNADGLKEILVYGEDSILTGNSGILAKLNGDGTFTTIQSGLKDGVKPTFIQTDIRCHIFNGEENLVYDGTTLHQSGIDASSVAPTQDSLIEGELNTDGSYFYVYRYLNTATFARSSLSPASEIFTTGSDSSQAGIRINITPGDSALADKIEVYRSVAGGNTLFLDGTTDITATTYDSTVSDAGLGSEAELDDSRLETAAGFAVITANQIFTAGFANDKNLIRPSKIGLFGPTPESYQVGDGIQCDPNDGDEIIGLGLAGSRVVVVKNGSIGALLPLEVNRTGLQRSGTEKYVYRNISDEFLGVAHGAIISLGRQCLILGKDDFYLTDGVEVKRIGRRIRRTVKSLNFNQAYKFSVIAKTDTEQILFSVVRRGATEPDFQIVAHYKDFPERLPFTFYSPGPDTTTHPGITAASFFHVTSENNKLLYFGSSAAEGKVYRLGFGSADNDLGIFWDCRLPWDGASNSTAPKLFHSYYLILASSGPSASNDVTFTFEENTIESIVKTATVSVQGTPGNWNAVNWNNFNWAGLAFKIAKFFPRRRAFLGRFGFRNTDANQNFAVKAISRVIQAVPQH